MKYLDTKIILLPSTTVEKLVEIGRTIHDIALVTGLETGWFTYKGKTRWTIRSVNSSIWYEVPKTFPALRGWEKVHEKKVEDFS